VKVKLDPVVSAAALVDALAVFPVVAPARIPVSVVPAAAVVGPDVQVNDDQLCQRGN